MCFCCKRIYKLAYIDSALDAILAQHDVVGADAEGYILRLNIICRKACLLILAGPNGDTARLNCVLAVFLNKLCIKEVHMRSAYLLNEAVLHNDYAVAESHCFGLIVGNIHKGAIREKGVEYLRKALLLDLRDIMGNTGKEGLHLACMGEAWQAALLM